MPEKRNELPRWARRFLQAICPATLYEEIEGDLIQRYNRHAAARGERHAQRTLLWNVICFFRPGIILRNSLRPLGDGAVLYHYLLTTGRHVRKHKVNALFRFGSLTLALFSFLVMALYVHYQTSFDRYHENYENIYRVNTERKEDGKVERYGIAPMGVGALLKDRFPEVEACTRLQIANGSYIRYKDKVIHAGVFPADSTFFNVLTFKFRSGDARALTRPASIAITATLAHNVFGDEEAMGKVVTVNGSPTLYEVTAVVEDMPSNSHFILDAFIPISSEPPFSLESIVSPVKFADESSALYVKLRAGANAAAFREKLQAMLDGHIGRKARTEYGFGIYLQPLADVYLDAPLKYEFTRKGSTLYLYIFSVLTVFLLLVASINYINLTVADFATRTREIGVRKAMGARRTQVAAQVVMEAVAFCLAALLVAGLLLYLFFPHVATALERDLSLSLLWNGKLLLTVAVVMAGLIVCSTAYPAYTLARSDASQNLKGMRAVTAHSRVGKTLLVSQFVIAIVSITCTLTVGNQLHYIHTKDLGFDRKNLVVIALPEDFTVQKIKAFKQSLKDVPGVANVSNSSFRVGGGYWKDWYQVDVNGEMKAMELYEVFSDDDLFGTLGMELLEGRLFDAGSPADSTAAYVINETGVRHLGLQHAVGTRITTHPEEGRWEGTIVGVVKDINIRTLHDKVQPLIMRLPWQHDYPEQFVYVRLAGPARETVEAIKQKHAEALPGYPVQLDFVDDFYNSRYDKENQAYASLRYGTVMILLLSSLGIFSLSMYLSVLRMKEFGIRKVLGATVAQIATLHIGYFLKLLLIANALALPFCYGWMHAWLENFAYKTTLSGWMFAGVAVVSLLLVVSSAAYAAWKAGRLNPVDVIKSA